MESKSRRVSVFLVEDETLIRMMIAGIVEELGHTVVAEAIDSRHLPFICASGYGAAGLPEKFRDRPVLQKPLVIQRLGEAIEAALE